MKQLQKYFRLPLGLALFIFSALIVYSPGLTGDFVFDDFANIVANKNIHALVLDWDTVAQAARAYQGPIGRPLATLGFAVDYALGGQQPFAFKLHGLLVHLVNSLLVLLLCRRLLLVNPGNRYPTWAAWFIAGLWAIHPLQVSTVLYVVQRMEMLATLFILLGLHSYLHARLQQMKDHRGWPWLVTSGLLAAMGLLAKESAVVFPLFTLALELTLLRFRAPNPATTRWLRRGYVALVLVGLVGYFGFVVPAYGDPHAFLNRDFTLYERLLTQCRVLPMYLGQMLLPLPDSMPFYYDSYAKSTGWLEPATTLLGGILLATLMMLAWSTRHRAPLFSLGLFWFFVPHLLTSGPINLELAFEHRNYAALLGVILALADLLRWMPFRPSREAALTGAAVLTAMMAALCGIRAATWGDPLVLAMDMASRNPASARASSDLGAVFAREAMSNPGSPYLDLALREFERGAALPGASPLPEQGLILISLAAGRPVQQSWWDQLHEKLRSNPIGPQEVMAVTGLLMERLEGTKVDDHALAEAYTILEKRGGASANAYLGFANHADAYIHDEVLAERMYIAAMASETMTAEYAQRILFALATEGKQRYVLAASREAAKRGFIPEQR